MNIKAINSANTAVFGNMQRAGKAAGNSADKAGKFDTFTMSGLGKSAEGVKPERKTSERQAELIRGLEKLPENEKASAAVGIYHHMQGLFGAAADAHRQAIDIFNNMREERSGLESLLENDCVITDENEKYTAKLIACSGKLGGDIDLSGFKKGCRVDRELVKAALDSVNGRLERFIRGERFGNKKFNSAQNNMGTTEFKRAADMFRAVTGGRDASLDIDGDDCMVVEGIDGINEENFIQKHTDAIARIEERSAGLKSFFEGYMKKNSLVSEAYESKDDHLAVKNIFDKLIRELDARAAGSSVIAEMLSGAEKDV